MAGLAFADELPEPGGLWVRHRPRRWPSVAGLWIDPLRGRLGRSGPAPGERAPEIGRDLDDVLYLPPVADEQAEWRDAVLAEASERGIPVLAQALPAGRLPGPGATPVYDLTEVLARRDLDRLDDLAEGAVYLWPLLRGLTDGEELVGAALARLAAARPRSVVSLVPDLDPGERRRLAELGDEDSWEALFHSGLPSPRDFCRAVRAAGLEPFLERPVPAGPARLVANRRLGEALAMTAELWLRLDRPGDLGQSLYRAARWADRERHDIGRLAADGNLGIVEGLDPQVRELIEEWRASGALGLLDELRREYLG